MSINDWCKYKPADLSLSVLNDLKKSLQLEDENFILSGDQLINFTGEKCYPHIIASITVLLRVLTELHKLLVDENTTVTQEPQALDKLSVIKKYSSPLQWIETDTAFIELFASIFQVGAITHQSHAITRKELFEIVAELFNLNIKDLECKLSRAKRRKRNETPFLNILRSAFLSLCMHKTTR